MTTSQDLVRTHIDFADRVACARKRHLPRRIDLDEIKSAAYMGLVQAAGRYDADRGVPFTTFAYPRIVGAILDYARELRGEVSLDAEDSDGGSLKDTVVARPDGDAEELFEDLTYGLDDRAVHVLRCYYIDDVPMKEIGSRIGVTESRVSQMLSTSRTEIRARYAA